eukprot:4624486-Alexandrium_andersonii.AAC.1
MLPRKHRTTRPEPNNHTEHPAQRRTTPQPARGTLVASVLPREAGTASYVGRGTATAPPRASSARGPA